MHSENESEKQITAIYVLNTHLLLFQIQNPLIADEKRKREEKRVKIFTTETVMYSIMRNQLDLGDVRYDMM